MTPIVILLLFVIALMIAAGLFLPGDTRPPIPPENGPASDVSSSVGSERD